MFGDQIHQLADLFKTCDPNAADSDSDEDRPKTNAKANLTPASFVTQTQKTNASVVQPPIKQSVNSKDIWQLEEVPESGSKLHDEIDKRPQPEYEMHYKQRITTEDIFLQMGNKNPSSASCEDLVVNIQLPETKLADIVLDITKSALDCRCPKYRLALSLPHPVDPDQCQAKWDKEKCSLQVTLRLNRDYDEFNF